MSSWWRQTQAHASVVCILTVKWSPDWNSAWWSLFLITPTRLSPLIKPVIASFAVSLHNVYTAPRFSMCTFGLRWNSLCKFNCFVLAGKPHCTPRKLSQFYKWNFPLSLVLAHQLWNELNFISKLNCAFCCRWRAQHGLMRAWSFCDYANHLGLTIYQCQYKPSCAQFCLRPAPALAPTPSTTTGKSSLGIIGINVRPHHVA